VGGYIQLRKKRARDPRVFSAATRLAAAGWKVSSPDGRELSPNDNTNALSNGLRGVTWALWAYADEHLRSDDTLRVTLDALAPIIGVPVEWLRELPPDWLEETPEGFVRLPGYCAANKLRGKDLRSADLDEKRLHERQLNAERQQRHRDKKKAERQKNVTGVTSRSRNGVTPPTGTGTGTLTLPGTVPLRAAARAVVEDPAAPREETPAAKAARSKLRGMVAGLRASKAIKPA
jgi:hypothetical protein